MMYLKQTENLFISLDREYQASKESGVLTMVTPTAFVSFLIIRLTCEFEQCIHEIVKNKWKNETKSEHLHDFIKEKVKLRSSKRTLLKKNLKEYLLRIDDINSLFENDRSKNYYDKLFGTERDENGENNIRNQIAHLLEFDFSLLPRWEEMYDYIEICDNVLNKIETNIKFVN